MPRCAPGTCCLEGPHHPRVLADQTQYRVIRIFWQKPLCFTGKVVACDRLWARRTGDQVLGQDVGLMRDPRVHAGPSLAACSLLALFGPAMLSKRERRGILTP